MKYSRIIIQFMLKCLQHEEVVQSWGMNRIHISDNTLQFSVSGFNYSGEIIVKADEKGFAFILNSAIGYIGTADTSIEAIKLLDKYIESNEEKYRNLFDSLII